MAGTVSSGARLVATLLVSSIVMFACGGGSSPTGSGAGKPATSYDFEVTTFEGERFAASENEGRPVVVNFWESW